MNRSKQELLKEQIDKLEMNEHIQLYSIVKKYTDVVTKTPTGIFVSTETLSQECLQEMERYVIFCVDQRKRMEEDMKTRKTYERMVE